MARSFADIFKTMDSQLSAASVEPGSVVAGIMAKAKAKHDADMTFERALQNKISIYTNDIGLGVKSNMSKTSLNKHSSKNFINMNRHRVKGSLIEYAMNISGNPAKTIENLSSKLSKACSGSSAR